MIGTVQRLQHDVVIAWPNISSIDLSLVQRTIESVVRQVSTAVRFLAVFSLVMGVPVLFSAVAALLPALAILAGMLALVLSIGVLAGREVYSGTPMDALREG